MMMPSCPVIQTARLRLRGPKADDFEYVAAFYADPNRAAGFGGPLKRDDAWRWFALSVGHWCLHGYGFWTVETNEGKTIGMVGLWNPEGWPEPELGWLLFEGAEGQGYAQEAAEAARRYAYEVLDLPALSSNIIPANTKSKSLATRMGAKYERTYDNVHMGEDELWRHPGPEAL